MNSSEQLSKSAIKIFNAASLEAVLSSGPFGEFAVLGVRILANYLYLISQFLNATTFRTSGASSLRMVFVMAGIRTGKCYSGHDHWY